MNPVLAELTKSDKFNEYLERIKKSNAPISILGLAGVGTLQIVASTEENIKRPVCLITYNELQAKKLAEEIRSYINGVFFFPKREILPSFIGSAPNTAFISSLLPEPISPANPRISPC